LAAASARGLLGLLIALAFLAGLFQICDNDVWWHIRTGEIVLDTGRVPRTDPFSHTAEGHVWITHEWLAEVITALVARGGGLAGVTLAKCAVAALLALVLWRLARGAGASASAAFLAVAFALATARFRLFERPHLATLILLPATLESCARAAARLDRGLRRRDLVVPAFFCLWANLHGGFLFGLLLMPIGLGAAALASARAGRGLGAPAVRRLAALIALSTAATLVNPNGYLAHLYPLVNARALRAVRNGEWLPPSLEQFPLFFAVLALLAVLALAFRRAAGASRLAPLAPLAVLALVSNRSIGEFAAAAAVPLALLLDAAGRAAPRATPHFLARAAPLLIAGLLVALHARGAVIDPSFYRFGLGVNASRFPIRQVEYLNQRALDGRLGNSPGFGGYLIWRLWPERKVFADGRLDVYVDLNETLNRTPWARTLDERGLGVAILDSEGGLGPDPLTRAIAESPDWALLEWDDVGMVWARITPSHEAAIRADRYHVASPIRDAGSIPDDSLTVAAAEYERAAREPQRFHALYGLGVVRLRAGDAAGAAPALEQAAALRPRDPGPWSDLALAFLASGRAADALPAARRAVRLSPRNPLAIRNLGVAMFDLGRIAEAEDAFRKAAAILPGNAEIVERIRECERRRAASGS